MKESLRFGPPDYLSLLSPNPPMKITPSFRDFFVSGLALVTTSLAFSQSSAVPLAERANDEALSKNQDSSQNEKPCMEAAATVGGSGSITGIVTRQFDVDAAFVNAIADARQAGGKRRA